MSEKKTEPMHLWSNHSTALNALRIEAAGQRYKQTAEVVYLVGAISESADLDTEINVASAPLGRVSENTVPNCTTDGTPGCRSRSGYSKRR